MYRIFMLLIVIALNQNLLAQSECVEADASVWENTWTSCEVGINPNDMRGVGYWVMYRFENPVNLSNTHIWNSNAQGETEKGFKEVIFDYSLDGQSWTTLDTVLFPQATGEAVYGGFEGPDFGGVEAQYVLLTALSNHGDADCYGIAEVKFNLLPKTIERADEEEDEEEGDCTSPEYNIVMHLNAFEVLLFWKEVEDVEEYVVYLRAEGQDEIQEFYTKESELFIGDLEPETTYEYAILALCGEGESEVEELLSFTTMSESDECTAPQRSGAFLSEENLAVVTWNEVPNAEAYQIRLRAANTLFWRTYGTEENWIEFEDLELETEYVYQIKTLCEATWTTYSEAFYFETWEEESDGDSLELAEFNQLNIFPNPARTQVSLTYKSVTTESIDIELRNIMGQLIWVKERKAEKGQNQYNFDLNNITTGVYTLSIRLEEGLLSRRLVIVNK